MEEGRGCQGEARHEEAKSPEGTERLQAEQGLVHQSTAGLRGEEAAGKDRDVAAEEKERIREEKERVGELTGDDFELHDEERMEGELDQGWEAILPRGNLRVLLVEDDDSTRHVVGALLRNCGYEGTYGGFVERSAS